MSEQVRYDALVIGAGFGGLGAALSLAEGGARVCLCETLRYAGGCASTFRRDGALFDAGATLVSGLARGQLFGDWLARHSPETTVDWIDPLVELRAPGLTIEARRDRARLVDAFAHLPHAPADRIRAFFARQASAAAVLWELFDEPDLLPPFSLSALLRHVSRLPRTLPLAGLVARSLADVLAEHGLEHFAPLRLYLDALCQITVQCSAAEAEAPFAFAAMDFYYRGTGHVRGGVGSLAKALLDGAARAGGDVRMANRVTALRRDAGDWVATTRRGEVRAHAVFANLLPSALDAMLPLEMMRRSSAAAELRARSALVEDGWGAAMIYAIAQPPEGARQEAHHLQLVADPGLPLAEGNHVFVSIGSALETERAPRGRRTMTMSTHVPLASLRAAGTNVGRYVEGVQQAMRRTLARRAPEWADGVERAMTASPRTFARFVGRPSGAVGGIPRRVGLASYADLGPKQPFDRLWMVGDSFFPGQSALATALGGVRASAALLGGPRAPARAATLADVATFGASPRSQTAT